MEENIKNKWIKFFIDTGILFAGSYIISIKSENISYFHGFGTLLVVFFILRLYYEYKFLKLREEMQRI